MPCPERDQTIYIQEKEVKTVNMYLGSMFDANGGAEKDVNNRDCLVKVEGNYWGDVRQEHTNKVERQSVQDGHTTGHGVWSRMLGSQGFGKVRANTKEVNNLLQKCQYYGR